MAIDSFPTSIGGLIDLLADLGAGANYQERLKELMIITPDNKRWKPRFLDYKTVKTNKTSEYDFSEKEGSYVQNFGRGSTDYSMQMIFDGLQYDKDATRFEASLGKKGASELRHPRYGTFDVVVTGWSRSDNDTSGAGKCAIDVGIKQTIKLVVPQSKLGGNSLFAQIAAFVNSAIDAYNTFESIVDTVTDDINKINSAVDGLSVAMSDIIAEVQAVDDKFKALASAIQNNITTLINEPAELATALSELFLVPSAVANDEDASSTASDIINAYESVYEGIQTTAPSGANNQQFVNDSLTTQLIAGLIVTSQAQTYVNGDYLTVADATAALDSLNNKFVENQDFLDGLQSAGAGNNLAFKFDVSDTQAQALKTVSSQASQILLETAFDAKREVVKTLIKPYTFITLCKELYGDTTNDNLHFLIDTNGLTGEELLLIPQGKEIKYYV